MWICPGPGLTHGGIPVRHQDDHGDGALIDQPLVGRPHQHLNGSHQGLVDVGAWDQRSNESQSEGNKNFPVTVPAMPHLRWAWCSGCTSLRRWPGWTSRAPAPRSSSARCGWSQRRWSGRPSSSRPEWPAWPPPSERGGGVRTEERWRTQGGAGGSGNNRHLPASSWRPTWSRWRQWRTQCFWGGGTGWTERRSGQNGRPRPGGERGRFKLRSLPEASVSVILMFLMFQSVIPAALQRCCLWSRRIWQWRRHRLRCRCSSHTSSAAAGSAWRRRGPEDNGNQTHTHRRQDYTEATEQEGKDTRR